MPPSKRLFRCLLVGEGNLPVPCGEILRERGHEICGVVPGDAALLEWADRNAIPHPGSEGDDLAFIRRQSFDYLLSIANRRVLRDEVLSLPGKWAINYHDAPLPKYAGMYATSWALLHQEPVHAVTWHIMVPEVDAGDILKQRAVTISAGETALTLNAKCFEAAIESFRELIDDIECDRAIGTPQDLTRRTYFPISRRPPAAGMLSFRAPAVELDAVVRALHFGPYPNPLGCAKVALGAEILVVTESDVDGSSADMPAGTVMLIDESTITIAAGDGKLAVRGLMTPDGRPLSILEVVSRYGLKVGTILPEPDPAILEPLESQYTSLARHEPYWVKKLAQLRPVALQRSASSAAPGEPGRYECIDATITVRVRDFAERHGPKTTLADVLIAGFAVYFARTGDSWCFDLGMGRDGVHGHAALDGLFASHVPFRVELDPSGNFLSALQAVRDESTATRKRGTYALDVLLRYPALRSSSDAARVESLPVHIHIVDSLADDSCRALGALTLIVPRTGPSYRCLCRPDQLDRREMAAIVERLTTMLEAAAVDPERPVSRLPMMTDEERDRILVAFNATLSDDSRPDSLCRLFETQARRAPDSPAIVLEDEELTYGELNARANRVARYLRSLGVGPEVPVGICVDRSFEMVVGLLGILKAGGAYVPLDPSYPEERLAFIVRDVRAPVILVQEHLRDRLPAQLADVVTLDRTRMLGGETSAKDLDGTADPRSMIAVLYTSGSTGQPKGVVIEAAGFTNLCRWYQAYMGATDRSRFLLLFAFGFDAAFKNIMTPLISGGTLVLTHTWEAEEILNAIASRRANVINTSPSLFHPLLDQEAKGGYARLSSLEHLALGGEPMALSRLRPWLESAACHCRLVNLYGPTEHSDISTEFVVDPAAIPVGDAVPIGRPIANNRVYVLDSHGNPQVVGLAGELYLGGIGVARGYWNRPELTDERFITNPCLPGERIYRTGDLARWTDEGILEYLGRIDHQIKIRGLRIELGEIETTLRRHPEVREVVVLAHESPEGDKYLVGYVVPKRREGVSIATLREYLRDLLPAFMVPSSFVILDAIPLLPSGKVDRRALRPPDRSARYLETGYIAPRNSLEAWLAEAWAAVLGLERIGIEDDFFEQGGHSLRVVNFLSRIKSAFGIALPVNMIFQAPTIKKMAIVLRQYLSETQTYSTRSNPGRPARPFFCTAFGSTLARSLKNTPVHSLEMSLPELRRVERIEDAARELIDRMRAEQPEGPYRLGGVGGMGIVVFEMAFQLLAVGERVGLLVLFDPPPIRSGLGHLAFGLRSAVSSGRKSLTRPFGRERSPEPARPAPNGIQPADHLKVLDKAIKRYRSRAYPGRIHLVVPMDHSHSADRDPASSWRHLAGTGLDVRHIPGHHLSLFEEPQHEVLTDVLSDWLEEEERQFEALGAVLSGWLEEDELQQTGSVAEGV